MLGYLTGDLDGLAAGTISQFREYSPRLDYIHLAAAHLADRRHPVDLAALGGLVEHAEARDIRLIGAQARRLRGVLAGDRSDLEVALAQFDAMGARPFAARVRTELGSVAGDQAMFERGLDELEALGDVDQAGRVSAERRAAART